MNGIVSGKKISSISDEAPTSIKNNFSFTQASPVDISNARCVVTGTTIKNRHALIFPQAQYGIFLDNAGGEIVLPSNNQITFGYTSNYHYIFDFDNMILTVDVGNVPISVLSMW